MKRLLTIMLIAAAFCSCQKGDKIVVTGNLQLETKASGEVKAATPAGGVAVSTPALSEFSLRITGDNYDRTWDSLADYSADERYAAGLYDIAIWYGDKAEEGYSKPYFSAVKNGVEVFDRNRTTNVSLTATVGNAIVEIVMTDNFKGYFVAHDFTVTTTTNTFDIDEAQDENLFVAPDQRVAIDCSCIRQYDVTTGTKTILPTQYINTEARTRYIVKYDLEQAGQVTVNISLDDTVIDTIELPVELNENA